MVENEPAVTLLNYYKAFKSLSGVMAGLLSIVPLLSVLPNALTAYLFPPVGVLEGPARIGTIIIAVSITYIAFFAGAEANDSNRQRILVAFIFGIVCFLAYLIFFDWFVRIVEIPAESTSIQVSVGYDRTAFATKTFDADSDWEMLRARGTGEEDLQKLWTARSLLVSRLSLIISYCLFVISLTAAFSWGVLEQCHGRA